MHYHWSIHKWKSLDIKRNKKNQKKNQENNIKNKKQNKKQEKNSKEGKEMDTTEALTHFMIMHEAGNVWNICVNTRAKQQQSRGCSRGMTREV